MRWTIKTSRKNVFSNKKTFFNFEELRKLQTLKMMAKKSSDRRYQQQFKELWQFCYSKIIKGFMKNAANEKLNAKQSSSLNTNRRLTRELFEFPLHWVASGETVNLVSTFVVPRAVFFDSGVGSGEAMTRRQERRKNLLEWSVGRIFFVNCFLFPQPFPSVKRSSLWSFQI